MNSTQSTHFIGIGGTGLSAIARVLVERGEHVTGSDREDSALAQSLRQIGVKVNIGHAAGNVNGATRVIRSSAVGDDNVEVQAARSKGLPVFKRSEFLGELLANQQVIAVAGSHGKTTTTAMIAWMLTALNQKPGYIIGSVAQNLGTNATAGAGRLFVIEADEYDYMFLGLKPKIAVVTNVEHDHPDLFLTPDDFHKTFEKFVDRLKPDGVLITCIDDVGAVKLEEYAIESRIEVIAYGFNGKYQYSDHSVGHSDYYLEDLRVDRDLGGNSFGIIRHLFAEDELLAEVSLRIPGSHNALNALASMIVAEKLGLDVGEAAMALSDFRGTARRFEERGEANGILIVDDYAHHPTEIRSTLAAARERYPKRRIIAVWQPHTYSRTSTLQQDFATAFKDADQVIVTDVYAAREQKPSGFDISAIVRSIQHPSSRFVPTLVEAHDLVLSELKPGDVLIVMSAGDAIELSVKLFESLKEKEAKHA